MRHTQQISRLSLLHHRHFSCKIKVLLFMHETLILARRGISDNFSSVATAQNYSASVNNIKLCCQTKNAQPESFRSISSSEI